MRKPLFPSHATPAFYLASPTVGGWLSSSPSRFNPHPCTPPRPLPSQITALPPRASTRCSRRAPCPTTCRPSSRSRTSILPPPSSRAWHGSSRRLTPSPQPAAPTFENTIVALERTGETLGRATRAFGILTGAMTNPTLQKLQTVLAPKGAAHRDAIRLNSALFARISAVHAARDPSASIPSPPACSTATTRTLSAAAPNSRRPTRPNSRP